MFHTTIKSQPNEDICLLFKPDNHSYNYICECGEASDLIIKECQDTNAIFISHCHIDHFINFDFILRHQIGIQRKVTICGPKGIAQQVQSKIKAFTWNLIAADAITYEIREILSLNEINIYQLKPPPWELEFLETISQKAIFENEKFAVNFTILDHKIPSIAYLFKEHDSVNIDLKNTEFRGGKWVRELKIAFEKNEPNQIIQIENQSFKAQDLFNLLTIKKGNSVGVIMDHAANDDNHQKILSLFSNADKVFMESFYKAEDQPQADLNFHSYSTASGKIMRKAKVKEAIPVHFSRRYDEADLAILLEEFNAAFSVK